MTGQERFPKRIFPRISQISISISGYGGRQQRIGVINELMGRELGAVFTGFVRGVEGKRPSGGDGRLHQN